MTVDKIIPCICTEHPPNVTESVYYGMPQIKVSGNYEPHKQFFTAFCPNCGRGDAFEFKSVYLALKDWNEMQKSLYEYNKREIIYDESLEDYKKRLVNKTVVFVKKCMKEVKEDKSYRNSKCFYFTPLIIKANLGLTDEEYYDIFDDVIKELKNCSEFSEISDETGDYTFSVDL